MIQIYNSSLYTQRNPYFTLEIYFHLFILAIFNIDRKWNSPGSYQLMNRKWKWDIQCNILAAIKNIEAIQFTGKWMKLETDILSEVTQSYDDKCHRFFHFWILALNLNLYVFCLERPQRSGNYKKPIGRGVQRRWDSIHC